MKLEEELENHKVPHLCIYGKFTKELINIDFSEIAAAERFVLVFDAINEIPKSIQYELIEHLKALKQFRGCRIIITYRTNRIDPDIEQALEMLCLDRFSFPGVSFESAIDTLTRLGIPNVHLYEDILYSNNPLQLNLLQNVLSHHKLTEKQRLNNITSITFIYEKYIKNILSHKYWEITKEISRWMYYNNEHSISHEQLTELISDDIADYISSMLQMGFLITYQLSDGVVYFEFGLESLSDFLIARNLLAELPKYDTRKQISLIKTKLDKMYRLEEAIILVLFDYFSPDYNTIKLLLNETGLINRFSWKTLRKIIFKEEAIVSFHSSFKTNEIEDTFREFAGYTAQPFNCTYYFNGIFRERKHQLKLSKILSGEHFHTALISRLKNILYTLNIGAVSSSRTEEAFWFALWCCAAPNTNIRNLSLKLLFDVVNNQADYQNKLITVFPIVVDHYIQDAIIYVLSKVDNDNSSDIRHFFQNLIDDKSFVLGRSLKRIASYMDTPYGYIQWEKENLRNDEYRVSEDIEQLISYIDLVDSDFFPFRYFSNTRIEMYRSFMDIDKKELAQWNKELAKTFKCVSRDSDCCGYMGFARKAEDLFNRHYEDAKMSSFSFYKSFAQIATDMLNMYPVEKQNGSWKHPDFAHSLVRKCLDIATDIVIGSFMCNYFASEFGTYNSIQDCLGYEVYDPLEYKDELPIISPLPTYHSESEMLSDSIISHLDLPEAKDEIWVRDVALTRKNILKLQHPVKKGKYEWIMIAGRIFCCEHSDHNLLWADNYDYWCCTSDTATLLGDRNDRYLTIELDNYYGTLSSYVHCKNKPWLCKIVPSLGSSSRSIFDETSLVLPPAELIAQLKLKVNAKNMTWVDTNNEIILYCNNTKYSYYTSPIGCTVFMRKDAYEEYIKKYPLKFFAFSERFHPNTGYAHETSIHFEIEHGQILREYHNYGKNSHEQPIQSDECKNCPYGFSDTFNERSKDFENLLKKLDYIYDDLDCDN